MRIEHRATNAAGLHDDQVGHRSAVPCVHVIRDRHRRSGAVIGEVELDGGQIAEAVLLLQIDADAVGRTGVQDRAGLVVQAEGIGRDDGSRVGSDFVDEQMLVALGRAAVLEHVAGLVAAGQEDRDALTVQPGAVVEQQRVGPRRRGEVVGREQSNGRVLAFVRPAVTVVVIPPLEPDHGLEVVWKENVVHHVDFEALRTGGHAVVVGLDVHTEHPWGHRVDGEGAVDHRDRSRTKPRGRHDPYLPRHRTKGVGCDGGEDEYAARRRVFNGDQILPEPNLDLCVSSEEGLVVGGGLLPTQVNGHVHWGSGNEVGHVRRDAPCGGGEVHAVKHEVVVQASAAVRPSVGGRHRIHAVSVHHAQVEVHGGRIVPKRGQTEDDLHLS